MNNIKLFPETLIAGKNWFVKTIPSELVPENKLKPITIEDNKIIWKMNDEDANDAVYWFKEWKKQGWFGVSEIFMWIKVPKNKTTDLMYCELVLSDDSSIGPSINFPHGKVEMIVR